MNKLLIRFKQFLLIGICILSYFSCTPEIKEQADAPKIKAGIAKVSGKVVNYQFNESEEVLIVMRLFHPVTAESEEFSTQLNKDGSFLFELPVECNTIASFHLLSQPEIWGSVCLVPDEETKLEIIFDETNKISVNMQSSFGLTSDDVLNIIEVSEEVFNESNNPYIIVDWTLKPDEFSEKRIAHLGEMLNIIESSSKLSELAKKVFLVTYKLFYLDSPLLQYSESMHLVYLDNREDKNAPDDFVPQEPDKSYYAFLKYFDLNNPQNLYAANYSDVLQTILSNKTLAIPPVKDTSIKDWLKEVKTTMADLIGSDTGLFYDMLVANAYAKQFNEENKPLSDKQKENISRYFADKSFVDILLAKNDEVLRIIEDNRNSTKVKINETPSVQKEKLMDAIISKYKGKNVVVDFWATWCGPCLAAMHEYKYLKNEMKDADIVFLYITTTSSPKGPWEKKVNEIGGEHYYLTQEEWDYIFDSIGFDAIPTYLFYDTNGILQNKITEFPGAEKMKAMITKLQYFPDLNFNIK